MKHKFSLIWRVAVALVLVLSFSLVVAAPVTAEPDVSNVWVQLTGTTPYDAGQTDVTYNVYFTPGADLATGVDTVSVLFPSAVGGTITTAEVTVDPDGDGVTKTGTAATAVTSASTSSLVVCTIPVDLEAGTEALISIAKVTNPAAGAKTLKVRTSQETTWAESSSYTIGAGLVTGVDFTPTTLTAGSASEYTITFNSTRALVGGLDTITVVFPTGTTVPSSIAKTHVTVEDKTGTIWGPTAPTSVAATVFGRFVELTVPGDVDAGDTVDVVFDATSGVRNGTLATATSGADGTRNNLLHLGDYVGKVYTNRDSAIVSVTTPYTISPAAISKLGFGATLPSYTSAALVEKNKVSGNIYVQTQDQYSNLKVVADTDLSVDLISDTTGTATFSANPVTIAINACEVSFTYQDTAAGTWTITASPPAAKTYTPATWEIKVEEAHVIALYDDTGVLVDDTYTTIQAAIDDAQTDFTVKLGPGTYTESPTIDVAKLTIESTDGADSTTIYGGSAANIVMVDAANVTIDGFTIKGNKTTGNQRGVYVKKSGFTIKNNTFTDIADDNIFVESENGAITSGTIDNNVITGLGVDMTLYSAGILVEAYSDNDISGITISNNTVSNCGTSAIGGRCASGISVSGGVFDSTGSDGKGEVSATVTGNTISDCYFGLGLRGSLTTLGSGTTPGAAEMVGNKAIADNTMSDCYGGVYLQWGHNAEFTLVNNTITNNTKYGIILSGDGNALTGTKTIHYNGIYGNGTYGISNAFTSVTNAPDAKYNWWGDASGPSGVGSGSGDAVSADVTYDPWLGASVSAAATATSAASLDAQTTVGVKVTGVNSKDIGVARYTANPQATPEFTPIDNGFFDVYVDDPTATSTEIGIKFYDSAITSDSVAYMWDAFEETWKLCTEQSTISGMVWVKARPYSATVPAVPTIQDLAGTPFAISTEEAPPEDILAYYRAYSGDPEVVETTDLLKAANDWANEVVPPDFTESISTTQLLELANEWAATE